MLQYVNVNTITSQTKEAVSEGSAKLRESGTRGHETPRIVPWKGARRVEKAARERDALAISSTSDRE